MSIKNLFNQDGANKILTPTSINESGDAVESGNYIVVYEDDRKRFVPQVDFSLPKNLTF